jgi:hypothetical protein
MEGDESVASGLGCQVAQDRQPHGTVRIARRAGDENDLERVGRSFVIDPLAHPRIAVDYDEMTHYAVEVLRGNRFDEARYVLRSSRYGQHGGHFLRHETSLRDMADVVQRRRSRGRQLDRVTIRGSLGHQSGRKKCHEDETQLTVATVR